MSCKFHRRVNHKGVTHLPPMPCVRCLPELTAPLRRCSIFRCTYYCHPIQSRECQKKDWAAHKEGCQRIEQQALLMDADLDRAQARGAWCTAGAERLAWIVRPEPGEHLAFIIQFNADILTTPHNATTVFTRREARCYTPGRLCAFIWEVLATPGSMFFPSNPEAEYRRLEKELELRAGAIPILIVDRGGHYPFNACTTRLSVDPAGGPLCVDWLRRRL
ncbi:hypothetical protein BV25DRAFT_1841910 [Artomyces pyxidatus]|uniref:Uncharacterized protein n=1 Tax=Artomyces pyxidatus TaxID=48021 RepID=A0ACB8SLC2_9AGAM|nr:hypothetical protein BV25DRAFT_1841910 [Artomyces pyxidatus]